METQEVNSKLSTQEYWDEVLKDAQLPRVNSPRSYLYRITMQFVDRFIKNGSYSTFFEVGCGSSGWLPYFAKEYNLTVSGLDYSDIGCRLARKNLELLNIPYGEILCKDLFEPDCTNGKKYDLAFSYGVIEHFENPGEIVKIFSGFLNEKGLMITLVPNMSGLAGRLTRHYIKDVYDIHRVITSEDLKEIHQKNGLEILRADYAGMFSFGVMPLIKSDKGMLKKGTARRKFSFFLINLFDKIIRNFFRIFPLQVSSRFFSPYVICVARKKTS